MASLEQLRTSLSPDRPLALGFARVHRADGQIARSGGELTAGEVVSLVFADSTPMRARIEGAGARPSRRQGRTTPQGELF